MRNFLLISLIYYSLSCTTNQTAEIYIPSDPRSDSVYFPIYQKHHRKQEVIHQFATHYTIDVTRLGPEFRTALGERYQKIFNEPQPLLAEVTAKTGFFVTVFIPDTKFHDLSDENIWNIQLKTAEEFAKPILIQRLRQKEKWLPFFPGITSWSQEYLILFDQVPIGGDGPHELLRTTTSELIISSFLGRVSLNW